MADVVEFKGKKMDAEAPEMSQDENAVIMATLENMMAVQQGHDQQISTLISLIGEMQAHIRDLEHDVAELKKPKKPAILNSVGGRAN